MTLKHIRFTDSPVMRELEKRAIAKGEQVIVKEASVEVDLTPSNDLLTDMFKLADGLRSRGMVREAESLEDAILQFKVAETHLYRAIDEDGEDLLGFAHPKGSAHVSESKDGHGDVEDLLTQHKKIVDIVNKTPTGKYASVVDELAFDLGLKKNAQSYNVNDYYDNIKTILKKLISFVSVIPKAQYFTAHGMRLTHNPYTFYIGEKGIVSHNALSLAKGDEMGPGEIVASGKVAEMALDFYKDSAGITKMMWEEFLNEGFDFPFASLFSEEKVSNANQDLLKVVDEYLINILKEAHPGVPPDMQKSASISVAIKHLDQFVKQIKSIFNNYSLFVFKVATNFNGDAENKIRVDYIPKLLSQTNELKKILTQKLEELTPSKKQEEKKPVPSEDGEILTSWWAHNLAGKFQRLSAAASKINHPAAGEFKKMSDILKANVNKPYKNVLSALVALDKSNEEYTDKHKLDRMAMAWEDYFRKELSKNKTANSDNQLVKEAIGMPPTTPAKAEPAKPATKPGAGMTGRAPARPAAKPPSEKEYEAVLSMQYSLHALSNALRDPKIRLSLMKAAKLSDEEAVRYANLIAGTGPGMRKHEDAPDGKWGTNTQNALAAAQKLIERIKTNSPDLLKGDVALYAPAQYNRGIKEEDVVNRANVNRASLNAFLEGVGAGHLVPKGEGEKADKQYDSLPAGLNMTGNDLMTKVNETGDIALNSADVSSFTALYNYIVKNGLGPAVSYDSSTGDIVEGYKLHVWKRIIHFLRFRAGDKVKANPEDKTAKAYRTATDRLLMTLSPLLERLREDENQTVSVYPANALDSNLATNKPGAGKPGRDSKTTKERASGGGGLEGQDYQNYSPNYSKDLIKQPISYNINLRQLAAAYPQEMKYYNSLYGRLLARKVQINVQEFRQDPEFLADNILRDPTIQEIKLLWPYLKPEDISFLEKYPFHPRTMEYMADAKLRLLSKVVIALRNDLKNVIDKWENNMYRAKVDERAVQANNTAWDAWSRALTQLVHRITQSLQKVNTGGGNYYSY